MKKLALLLVSVMLSISIVACSDDDGAEVIFYIVRHAETYSNAEHGLYGWRDSPLNDDGINATLYQKTNTNWAAGGLGGIAFQAAYSSTSGRAISTARILMGYPLPLSGHSYTDLSPSINASQGRSGRIITDPRLREINFGRFEGLIMETTATINTGNLAHDVALGPELGPRLGSAVGAQASLYFGLVDYGIVRYEPLIQMGYTIFDFADGIHEIDGRSGSVNIPYLDLVHTAEFLTIQLSPSLNVTVPAPDRTNTKRTVYPAANLPRAESDAQLRYRIEQGIRDIARTESARGEGNVLVVAHGITIMALVDIFGGIEGVASPELIEVGRINNNSVLRVRYRDGNFTIIDHTFRPPLPF